jgi:PleD family two-component response regulator
MTSLKLPTLLVITELPPVRYWVKEQLEKQFYLINATTEKKALETVKTAHLDFIIIDGSMEECDPLSLSTKIRNLAPHDPFPILLITGRLKKTYRDIALEAGVTDFLSEELDREELEMRIATGQRSAEVRQKVVGISMTLAKTKADSKAKYLKNKDLMEDRLVRFLDTAKKENKQVTMLLGQIDAFTALQSSYRLSTAEILIPLADLLNQSLQGNEISTPSSDGQFIILLTGVNPIETKKTAQNFQKMINKHRFLTKRGPIKITASFALSKVDANEPSLNKMITIANTSLKQNVLKKNFIVSLDSGNEP